MLAACSSLPARSSSKPCPMVCPRATRPGATASAIPSARRTPLLLWRIEPAEVVQHQATLFRGERLQFVPCGVAEPRASPRRSGLEGGGNVDAVARRRPAHALLGLVRLVVREGAAGIEQPVVQALLPVDRPLVQATGFELAGQLPGLLRERAGGGADALRLHPLELLGERALSRRQSAQLLQDRLARPYPHHGQQTLGLAVELLLVAGQAREPLDRFGEPAPRFRPAHLFAALGEGHGDG